jgi:hypothetical protein
MERLANYTYKLALESNHLCSQQENNIYEQDHFETPAASVCMNVRQYINRSVSGRLETS